MIETIEYKGTIYPSFQAIGRASQFAIPYALHVCNGIGVDVGCMKKEWAFPGAIPVDISFNDGYHATKLPDVDINYIFSSHCLEHILNWVDVLDYWDSRLKKGGVIFLYLPHYSQKYWRPWNDRKHVNILTPECIEDYFKEKFYSKIFVSGVDLNNSFMVMVEK